MGKEKIEERIRKGEGTSEGSVVESKKSLK